MARTISLWVVVIGLAACAEVQQKPVRNAAPQEDISQTKFSQAELQAEFYYDLGPDTIDVSGYSKSYQDEYSLFARICSQCHTLARPVNSPRQTHSSWSHYVFSMRMEARSEVAANFTRDEARQIVDFLTYDSLARKDGNREAFEALAQKLQDRFREINQERFRRTQEALPKLMRSQ